MYPAGRKSHAIRMYLHFDNILIDTGGSISFGASLAG
jgi:hypothetical protein